MFSFFNQQFFAVGLLHFLAAKEIKNQTSHQLVTKNHQFFPFGAPMEEEMNIGVDSIQLT